MKPLVSVCIPTFNRGELLLEALKSAQNQTYRNLEIVISDNHSQDYTAASIKKEKDRRIRFYFQKKNLGMVGNWNFCLKKASGEYIKFLASDDLLEQECVERLVSAAEKNSGSSIITCQRKYIDGNGATIRKMQFAHQNKRVNGLNHARWILSTIRENKIGEPTAILFKKIDTEKIGGFDPQFPQFADFEYWIRLCRLGDIYYLHKPLCSFRVHPDSHTVSTQNTGRFIEETFLLINKYYLDRRLRKAYGLTADDHAEVVKTKTLDIIKNIKDLFVSGNFRQAKKYFALLNAHASIDAITKLTIAHLLSK